MGVWDPGVVGVKGDRRFWGGRDLVRGGVRRWGDLGYGSRDGEVLGWRCRQ